MTDKQRDRQSDDEFRKQAIDWLNEKNWTKEEIAEKMLQCTQVAIRVATNHYKNSIIEKAIDSILQPPSLK